jgi:hypothetical protein
MNPVVERIQDSTCSGRRWCASSRSIIKKVTEKMRHRDKTTFQTTSRSSVPRQETNVELVNRASIKAKMLADAAVRGAWGFDGRRCRDE